MYRFDKLKFISLCLSLALLVGCTTPSDVASSTTASPLIKQTDESNGGESEPIERFPYRQMASGEKYDYSYGKEITEPSFPSNYHTTNILYESTEYTKLPQLPHEVTLYLPFSESRETPYIVADKDVSDRIIERITKEALAVVGTGCPDMRGKAKYDAMTTVDEYVDVYQFGVINNVVSFEISRRLRFETLGEDNISWVHASTYMVFDLNTGDLVPLSAVFVDGYDYKARLNEIVREHILENAGESEQNYSGTFTMLAPFSGIRNDQPFYLTSDHLVLILDFENHEFGINDAQYGIVIPLYELSDCLAIFDRYDTKKSLYEDEKKYVLTGIDGYTDSSSLVEDFSQPEKYFYNILSHETQEIPENAKTAFSNFKRQNVLSVANFKVVADTDIKNSPSDACRTYEVNTSSRLIGDYAILTIGESYTGFANDKSGKFVQHTFCYNIKEDRPASIEDYFKNGYNYVDMLDKYFRSQTHLAKVFDYIKSTSVLIDTDPQSPVRPIPNDMICLTPDRQGFSFTINLSPNGVLGKMYEDNYTLTGYIRYENIGYNNLTMFS